MRVAAVSFARHASDVASSTPVDEAVGHDLDAYILQRYERVVLRTFYLEAPLFPFFLNKTFDIDSDAGLI